MKTMITIGRQFGSGGKEIGIRVAKELGIPFYDKELLQEAAKKSGLCQKIFENFDERPKSLLYAIAMDAYPLGFSGITGESLEQQVHLAIFKTIRQIADFGISCVIVTHNMEQAKRVSDRTAFFYMGDMVETGTTRQVFLDPQDQRLVDYLTGRFG